jgi:hypothetical protein
MLGRKCACMTYCSAGERRSRKQLSSELHTMALPVATLMRIRIASPYSFSLMFFPSERSATIQYTFAIQEPRLKPHARGLVQSVFNPPPRLARFQPDLDMIRRVAGPKTLCIMRRTFLCRVGNGV